MGPGEDWTRSTRSVNLFDSMPITCRLHVPAAVVESVEALSGGILANSSLSFTSKDSYRLWKYDLARIP